MDHYQRRKYIHSLLPFAADGVGFVEDVGDPLLLRQRRQRDFNAT